MEYMGTIKIISCLNTKQNLESHCINRNRFQVCWKWFWLWLWVAMWWPLPIRPYFLIGDFTSFELFFILVSMTKSAKMSHWYKREIHREREEKNVIVMCVCRWLSSSYSTLHWHVPNIFTIRWFHLKIDFASKKTEQISISIRDVSSHRIQAPVKKTRNWHGFSYESTQKYTFRGRKR